MAFYTIFEQIAILAILAAAGVLAVFVALAVLLVGLPIISKLTRGNDAKQVEVQKVEYKLIKSGPDYTVTQAAGPK